MLYLFWLKVSNLDYLGNIDKLDKLMQCFNLGFLSSHSGSNVQAIIDAYKDSKICSTPKVVISNNSNAFVLERAKNEGLEAFHISSKSYTSELELDNALIEKFEESDVDLIILAGYMKKIGSKFVNHYQNRILNIHPALLPKYGGEGMYGMNVHKAVFENKEQLSGATIHLVDEDYDRGRIINQMSVELDKDDSPEIIAEKVLKIEHILYYSTIRQIELGNIIL